MQSKLEYLPLKCKGVEVESSKKWKYLSTYI